MKIILTKLKELPNAVHPNNKEEGYFKEGEFISYPEIGRPFYVGYNFRTSIVKEIIDEHTFMTMNSIYKFQEIPFNNHE